MTIHHAILKKAAKHNVTLEERKAENGTVHYAALHADLKEEHTGTPSEALTSALIALGYEKAKGPKKVKAANDAPPLTKKPRKAKAKKEKKPKVVIVNKSVVRKPYKEQYKKSGSGQGCGDRLDVAIKDALEGDEGALTKIAKSNNVPYVWQVLNKGLQRMNLSNVLRARVKRGEKVDVMGKTIASL